MLFLNLLIGLAVTAIAQETGISQLPACAQACLGTATGQQGGCSNVDIKCLCSNISYINVLSCCISTKCSSEDQQKAISFNTQLCAGVNVTIPNFLGCAATTSPVSGSKTSKPASSLISGSSKTSTDFSASVVKKIGTAITLPTNPPLAQYTGGRLLEGSCTIPQFASVTVDGGGVLEYPWLGCSYESPACCPFDIHIGGALSVCPNDYVTTGRACCPSGWSVYSTAFAGQTPCYTNPPTPLIPPAAASATKGALISVINTKLFTLQYTLKPQKQGLSTAAKAGIAIGILVGALAALALFLFFFIRKRRATKRKLMQRPIPPPSPPFIEPFVRDPRDSTYSQAGIPLGPLSELPSPAPDQHRMGFPQPQSPAPTLAAAAPPPLPPPSLPPPPPAEMPGDTFLHEHHPAYAPPSIVVNEGIQAAANSQPGTPGGRDIATTR